MKRNKVNRKIKAGGDIDAEKLVYILLVSFIVFACIMAIAGL